MVHQDRDVLATLAQGRQDDRDDVEAVVQVLAELGLRDELLEVALRSGDHPDVDRNRPRAADALHGAVLQHAQQLHLHGVRDVVDVVEEDRAALGELEPARPILDGAGERPALVAEQLRLDERLGEDRAAHGHERPVPPRARVVNQVGDELLAGSGFPRDEHAAVTVGNDAYEVEHRAHAGASADHDRVDGERASIRHGVSPGLRGFER